MDRPFQRALRRRRPGGAWLQVPGEPVRWYDPLVINEVIEKEIVWRAIVYCLIDLRDV